MLYKRTRGSDGSLSSCILEAHIKGKRGWVDIKAFLGPASIGVFEMSNNQDVDYYFILKFKQ